MNCKDCKNWRFCFGQDEVCDEFRSYTEERHKAGLRTVAEIVDELDKMFNQERN